MLNFRLFSQKYLNDNHFSQNKKSEYKNNKILIELTGNGAVKLRESICDYLDEGKYCYLIDLKHVKNIDGLRLQALEYFINRAVHVRLFNVNGDIRFMINLSGKEAVFKIYNESDSDKAVSMFEKEIPEEKAITDEVNKRRHLCIDTFFKALNIIPAITV